MSPCLKGCKFAKKVSKVGVTPGGKQQYVVTCSKENTTQMIDYDEQYELVCKK